MVIAGEAETGIPDVKRFAVELEFVQCLANPHYLNCEILVWGEELRSEGGGNGRWFNQEYAVLERGQSNTFSARPVTDGRVSQFHSHPSLPLQGWHSSAS